MNQKSDLCPSCGVPCDRTDTWPADIPYARIRVVLSADGGYVLVYPNPGCDCVAVYCRTAEEYGRVRGANTHKDQGLSILSC